MIEPVIGGGKSMVLCTCDACGAEVNFSAVHGRSGSPGSKHRLQLASLSAVHASLRKRGWAVARNKLRCDICAAAKLMKPRCLKDVGENHESEVTMKAENVTDLRQPTREQSREISSLLHMEYDTKAERYRGDSTDKTIADIVGGGCMPGWVAAVRIRDFGDNAGNELTAAAFSDVAAVRAALSDAQDDFLKAHMTALAQIDEAVAHFEAKVAPLVSRFSGIEATQARIVKAVGPKAGGR